MAPSLVDVDDLRRWLGLAALDDDQTLRAAAHIAAASGAVRSYAGADFVDDDTGALDPELPENVRTVTLQVAERLWRVPGGIKAETAGPFTGQFVDDPLELTPAEKKLVDDAVGRATSGGLYVIGTTRGPIETRRYRDRGYHRDRNTWLDEGDDGW